MTPHPPKTWWIVKGKITARYGSVGACARALGCSTDALAKAVQGRCPGIAEQLKAAINFNWDDKAALEAERTAMVGAPVDTLEARL